MVIILSAKNSIPSAPSTVGPVRRVLSPLQSNLLEFGGLASHRRNTRDASTSLCSSTSEIRSINRVTYQENVEEESGGFEEGGEKTRFGTLQKQRKQLTNDFRTPSNINGARMHGNQVSLLTFFNQKSFEYSMLSLLGKLLFPV